jgi:polyisoprenoid-binding protein YceI
MTATIDISTTPTTWSLDPAHSEVGFAVKHMMISTVRGRFGGVEGTIRLDESDPSRSSVEVGIDVASIDTRQDQRDAHLRSADFFDAEAFPRITFRSRRVEPVAEGAFRVIGDLTIRDVTREVTLTATDEGRGTDPWGAEKAAFAATTSIDRRDFGLTWNQALEAGGVLVANEVRISLEIQAVKA